MDPMSIAAMIGMVVGIISKSQTIITDLVDIIRRVKSAPITLQSVRAQLDATESVMRKIREFLEDRGDELSVEDRRSLNQSLVHCQRMIDELYRLTQGLLNGKDKMGWLRHVQVALNERSIERCENGLIRGLTALVQQFDVISRIELENRTLERQDKRFVIIINNADQSSREVCSEVSHMYSIYSKFESERDKEPSRRVLGFSEKPPPRTERLGRLGAGNPSSASRPPSELPGSTPRPAQVGRPQASATPRPMPPMPLLPNLQPSPQIRQRAGGDGRDDSSPSSSSNEDAPGRGGNNRIYEEEDQVQPRGADRDSPDNTNSSLNTGSTQPHGQVTRGQPPGSNVGGTRAAGQAAGGTQNSALPGGQSPAIYLDSRIMTWQEAKDEIATLAELVCQSLGQQPASNSACYFSVLTNLEKLFNFTANLLKSGDLCGDKVEISMNGLVRAARRLDLFTMTELVTAGADVNKKDRHGDAPLLAISGKDSPSVKVLSAVQYLIRRGADVKQRGFRDITALHTMARNGQLETVELLLHHGASIEAKRAENIDRHRTPLHDACASSHYLKGAIVKLLLDRGADVKRPFFSPYDPYWVYKSPVDLCLESLAVSEAQLVNLDFSDGTRIAKLYRACRQLRAEVVALTEVMEDVPRNELFIHADAKRCLSTSVVLKDLRDMQEIGVVRARQSLRSLIAKMALATDEELYQCWP